jgi:hypothetical protein
MSKKNHSPGPVPPGNQPKSGQALGDEAPEAPNTGEENASASFQEQDPKRRLGNFSGAGEHPRQQPGRLNDGDVHSQ